MYPRVGEKRRLEDINLEDEEAIGSLCRLSGRPVSPKSAMEQEKRIRREIANSNERRRMQSINAGFASLKTLLPHQEGEKLSKAAILQQTAEYIYQLEQEKTRLLSQNCQLKRLLNQHQSDGEGSPTGGDSPCEDRSVTEGTPPPPSSTMTTQLSGANQESLGSPATEDLRREVIDTRVHLDRERKHRLKLEEHIRGLEAEIYPEKMKEITHQVKHDYSSVERRQSVDTVKIEIKEEDFHGKNGHHPKTTVSEIISADHVIYSNDNVQEIRLPKTFGKHVSANVQHVTKVPIASATNLSVQGRNTAVLQPTIVTVLPSNKVPSNALPAQVLEWRDVDEVPGATITSECVDGTLAPLNHTRVFIVNSTNSPCQKSLDTICEAIRHLEGDHMFPIEDHGSTPRIEEEVVTEETYTIEEGHHSVPQGNYENFQCSSSPDEMAAPSHHNLGGSMSHLTLHMIQPEPQEVPLELTTTHRVSEPSQQYTQSDEAPTNPNKKRRTEISSHSANIIRSQTSTRPGVIVVKHT